MPHCHSKHINKATQVDFLGYLCYNKIILIIKVDKCYLMIPYNKKLVSNAKSLRKNMTPEEKRLWYDFLKRLPLNVRRQHNIGNYIVDFYIASKKVVIEIDGIQHTALENKAADTEMTGEEKNLLTEAQGFETKFDEAMDDDFNTADALAAIFELVKFVNSNAKAESSKAFLEALKQEIVTLSDICGLIVDKKAEMLDSDIEALIEERQAARKAKNFARADEIRDELLAKGIVLEDTREGVKWKRA